MNRVKGFTLIELMIVVAIVSLLAAVALPSYSKHVLKSHRPNAVTGVLDLAARQARYYTTNNAYAGNMTLLGYAADPMPLDNAQSYYYELSVESASTTAFVVKAVPHGKQTSDVCGTFKYDDMGKRTMSGGTGSVAECWKQ